MGIVQSKNNAIEKLLNIDIVPSTNISTGSIDFLNTLELSDVILKKSEIPPIHWSETSFEIKTIAESIKTYINTNPNFGDYEKKFINFCLNIAYNIHVDEKRKNGIAYFSHPLKVMLNLIPENPNYISLAAAAMHDVPESCVEKDFNKQQDSLEKKIDENIWEFHSGALNHFSFDNEFLHAFKYGLFKFEDIEKQDVALESYFSIIEKYSKIQERKFKKANNSIIDKSHVHTEADIADYIKSDIYLALKEIFFNKAKSKLRQQYLKKLKNELAIFVFDNVKPNEFGKRKIQVELLMDPLISNLSRYKGLIQSYEQHLNDISPYTTFDKKGNPLVISGTVPNKNYLIGDYKIKTKIKSHLAMSQVKSSDRLANLSELWSFGNNLSKEALLEMNNYLEALYNTDKKRYYQEKEIIYESHMQPNMKKSNFMNGQKRLYEMAKSIMALNAIRMQRIYMQEKGYNYPELESIINLQNKLAEKGINQSELHALHLKYFHKEVDIDFVKKAEEDLTVYENKGGLSKITEPYKGEKLTSETSYKRFDGTMRVFSKIMLHHSPTKAEISEDKQIQYLSAISFKREFELFRENSNYYIKGFENILPPVLRQSYTIQQNIKEGEMKK